MARIRTIKPEFWTSEQVMELSPTARLAFIGMWNFCDDQGVHPASAKTLKAEVFPSDDISSADVQAMVDQMIENGLLKVFESSGKAYWWVTGWNHQKIEKPTRKYPEPDFSTTSSVVLDESSANGRRVLVESSTPEGKGREKEGKGKEVKPSAPSAPAAKPKFDPGKVELPESIRADVWAKWIAYRRERKLSCSETCIAQQVENLSGWATAGHDPNEIIRASIANGWQGLFEPKGVKPVALPAKAAPTLRMHHLGFVEERILTGGFPAWAATPFNSFDEYHAAHAGEEAA